MFHGNGGNVGHRLPLAAIFYKRMRCNVFMMSYRGFVAFLLKRLALNFNKKYVAMASRRDLPLNKVRFYAREHGP